MELKGYVKVKVVDFDLPRNPFNGIESILSQSSHPTSSMSRNPFNGIESVDDAMETPVDTGLIRIHSMELKATFQDKPA